MVKVKPVSSAVKAPNVAACKEGVKQDGTDKKAVHSKGTKKTTKKQAPSNKQEDKG